MISQTQLWTNIFCYEGKVRVDVRLTRGMHVGCFPNKGDGIQSKKDTAGTTLVMHGCIYISAVVLVS